MPRTGPQDVPSDDAFVLASNDDPAAEDAHAAGELVLPRGLRVNLERDILVRWECRALAEGGKDDLLRAGRDLLPPEGDAKWTARPGDDRARLVLASDPDSRLLSSRSLEGDGCARRSDREFLSGTANHPGGTAARITISDVLLEPISGTEV